MKQVLISIVALALLAGCTANGSEGEGPTDESAALAAANAAAYRGDYEAAARRYRPLAEAGNVKAQVKMGTLYYNGLGVPKDQAETARWWRLAAEQGLASAQNDLGYLYARGHGVPQDFAEAARWYRMAAEQGDSYAQAGLAGAYDKGRGVAQDYTEAARWYREAAMQGIAKAQFNLGVMYLTGEGVERDPVNAYAWFMLAREDKTVRDRAARRTAKLEPRLTAAEVAKAERLAAEWRAKIAAAEGAKQ